jgi:hypothetical protein
MVHRIEEKFGHVKLYRRIFTAQSTAAVILKICVACALLTSCVSPFVKTDEPVEVESRKREEIARHGLSYVGMKDLQEESAQFRNDCSGFVVGVYRSLGYRVELTYYNSRYVAENLYKNLRAKGLVYGGSRPRKADLVFFRNTVANSGGRVTHVGIVTDIEQNGTIVVVHYSSTGVRLMRMNLNSPHKHRDAGGVVLNDFLRKKPPGGADARLLSGELFFMYGDLYSFILQ